MSKIPKFVWVQAALKKGIAKIEKWYKATSQTDISFSCLGTFLPHVSHWVSVYLAFELVLDSCIKAEYAKQSWDPP
jgi:hypothetical protein